MNHIHDLLKSLFIMSSMVEARDPYTGGHLWRVSQYARILSEQAGLERTEVARIALGGFLHDLGKVGVPDAILNKADRLAPHEYDLMKTHPEVGSNLLSDHPLAELARGAVLGHHETPDGKGYPYHLSADRIGIDARIVGICDAFDAMTSNRPYRKGMPLEQAFGIIHDNLGRQFDARLGVQFLALEGKGVLEHIAGHSEPGIPLQECPICGPIIVVSRNHRSGNLVYCRNCGGEVEITRDGDRIGVKPTGRRGSPADLAADVDNELIEDLVEESSRFLRIGTTRKESTFARWFDRVAGIPAAPD